MTIIRQGDLMLRKVNSKNVPKDFEYKKAGPTTIGYGEVTGHHHTLDEARWLVHPGADVEQFALDGNPKVQTIGEQPRMFLVVDNTEGNTALRHQEHAPIKVDNGTYEVIRQREYDPVEGFRAVAD